jgi:hypothetical protein
MAIWRGAKNIQENPFAFAFISLHPRIEQLGSQNWQAEMKANLYDSFLWKELTNSWFKCEDAVKEARELGELVSKYERKEPTCTSGACHVEGNVHCHVPVET